MATRVLVFVVLIVNMLVTVLLYQVLVLVAIVLMSHFLMLMLVLMLILVMTAHFLSPPFLINFTTNRSIKRLPLAPHRNNYKSSIRLPIMKECQGDGYR